MFKIFSHFSKVLLHKYFWTFGVERLRTKILNIAKTHELLVKTEISDM